MPDNLECWLFSGRCWAQSRRRVAVVGSYPAMLEPSEQMSWMNSVMWCHSEQTVCKLWSQLGLKYSFWTYSNREIKWAVWCQLVILNILTQLMLILREGILSMVKQVRSVLPHYLNTVQWWDLLILSSYENVWAAKVKEEIGLPDIVVNNAGSYYMQVDKTCFQFWMLLQVFRVQFWSSSNDSALFRTFLTATTPAGRGW